MKKTILKKMVLLAGLVVLQLASLGQGDSIIIQPDGHNYTDYFNSITQFEPSRIPTGYLYDMVYPTAHLDSIDPCDTIEVYDIFQGWWEMENAQVSVVPTLTYDSMRKDVMVQNLSHRIPILSLDMDFASIDDNALADGRLLLQDSIYVDAMLVSPYNQHHFGIVGLSSNSLSSGIDNILYFEDQHFYSNTGSHIEHIKITREGHSPFYVYPNQKYVFNTETLGEEYWDIEVELEGNDPNPCSKQKITIGEPKYKKKANCEDGELWIIESDIPFQGYQESFATNSIADAHIYYHKTGGAIGQECEIIKPIIIVDGFDPKDKRSSDRIFNEKMVYSNGTTPMPNLVTDFQQMGFDVIILNFPVIGSEAISYKTDVVRYKSDGSFDRYQSMPGRDGGADYIERNAFLTVKLIQEVNAKLAQNGSSEELVVVGPSMGGMITRYALSYMEEQQNTGTPNMDHNTRLWLSFDAPHKGANISLGTQYTLDYFGNFKGDQEQKDAFANELRSPAGRQLLMDQYDAAWSTTNFQSDFFHQTFYTKVANTGLSGAGGYPSNVRKVSLLNGTLNGTNSFNPGDFDVFIKAKKAGVEVFKLITRYGADNGGSSKVFEGKFAELNGSWWPPSASLTIYSASITKTNNNIFGSMDAVQGSFYTDPKGISAGIVEQLKDQDVKDDKIDIYYDDLAFTFIPSFSALDLDDYGVFHWNSDQSYFDNSCMNRTPFDSYYAPEANEDHIFLTADNVAWVKQEVEKGKPGCSRVCPKKEDWPARLCRGTSEDFELRNLPGGSKTINWSMDNPKLSVASGQGSYLADIAASTGQYANIYSTVTAIISTPCAADYVLSGTVEIPSTQLAITGDDDICQFFPKTYQKSSLSDSRNHHWYFGDAAGTYYTSSPYNNVSFPSDDYNGSQYSGTNATFGGMRVGNYILYLDAENRCNEPMTASKNVSIVPLISGCGSFKKDPDLEYTNILKIYPNPTSNVWTITLNQEYDYEINQYQLVDMFGKEVYAADQLGASFIELNSEGLRHGIYFLKVFTADGNKHIHKLMKH
jgi:hypothetical protein